MDVPQELRELRRLYWRALKKRVRHGASAAVDEVRGFVSLCRNRESLDLAAVRREVRRLTTVLDRE